MIEFARIVRFALVGLGATGIHFAVLSALVPVMPLVALANLPALLLGTAASYLGNRNWVFSDSPGYSFAAARFFVMYVALSLLHAVAMAVLADALGVHYIPSFVAATSTTAALAFLGNRYLVFGGRIA